MLEQKKLNEFFKNVMHLSKGEKAILARNYSLFEDANYNVILTLLKCVPDDVYVSKIDYQNLLFVASIRCELGYVKEKYPSNIVASVIKKMQDGDTKFSDLLMQDTATGRVYPLMRRYLSMYKNPIDVHALYYNLSAWDEPLHKTRYKWASAWAKASKK